MVEPLKLLYDYEKAFSIALFCDFNCRKCIGTDI